MTATCTTTRGIPYQVIKASFEKLRKDLCWERIRKQRSPLEFLCLKFHFAFPCLSSEIQVKQAMAQSVDGTLAEKKRMLWNVFYVFEWSSIDV